MIMNGKLYALVASVKAWLMLPFSALIFQSLQIIFANEHKTTTNNQKNQFSKAYSEIYFKLGKTEFKNGLSPRNKSLFLFLMSMHR